MLTEKDRNFINNYHSLERIYIFLFFFLIIFALIYYILIFKRLIPIYLISLKSLPEGYSELVKFIYSALTKLAGSGFVWLAIILGFFIGNFIIYRRTKNIFDKISKQ